jgi:hypothetical protein
MVRRPLYQIYPSLGQPKSQVRQETVQKVGCTGILVTTRLLGILDPLIPKRKQPVNKTREGRLDVKVALRYIPVGDAIAPPNISSKA